MKKHIVFIAVLMLALPVMGQSGTNSPYSQYGLGRMADASQSASRGMNGVGVAFREHNQVNTLNPASYSSVDSLTFMFDIGMSLQRTHFKENGKSKNANNADFEYAVGAFRAWKNVGVAFGILPYTNVGYSYEQTTKMKNYEIPSTTSEPVEQTNSYDGEGGLHKVFVGVGVQPFKNFSVGVNINYMWGNISNLVTSSYTDSYVKSFMKFYYVETKNITFDFGASYTLNASKHDQFTVGGTITPGSSLSKDPWCYVITSNAQDGVIDTTTYTAAGAYNIPISFAAGLSYKRDDKLLIGVDYSYYRGSSVHVRDYVNSAGIKAETSDRMMDRHKVNIGAQYVRNPQSRKYSDRIVYRAGASYATPYVKVNSLDGPKEIAVSAGIGLPITNMYNNRSMLNIGVRWINNNPSSSSLLRENCFMINLGMTFNERWFAKWKFE